MRRQFRVLRRDFEDYWNRPVPPSGDPQAPLLIVGLAPGKQGANRTGRPFVGDASGALLFGVLESLGIQDRVRITNAVKCLPMANHPNAAEVNNCQRFLAAELTTAAVILVLGGIAHRAAVKALGCRQVDFPFAHGAVHHLANCVLIDSYHCSRYNTQTGRLTEAMFRDVVESAARYAGLPILTV